MLLSSKPSLLLLLSSLLGASSVAAGIAGFQLQHEPHYTHDNGQNNIYSGENKDDLDAIIAQSSFLSLHRRLVEIESISNNEQTVGDFVVQYLKARSFTVEKQPVGLDSDSDGHHSKRFNIYAYPNNHSTPGIILTSHIDTVPPFIPYSLSTPSSSSSFKREDVLISGRGTVDAKASVACQIIATLDHLAKHPNVPIGLLFVVSEETGGKGMVKFSKSPLNSNPPTFHTVVFGEPTERALVSGHKGSLGVFLQVKGKAAHSGYPWLGRSAVSEILPILGKLDNLGDIPVSKGGLPSSKKYGASTLNIGSIRAGFAGNVVPELASAVISVRIAGGTATQVKDIIAAAVKSEAGRDMKLVVRDGVIRDDDEEARNADITLSFPSEGYGPVDLDADIDGFKVITVNYGTDVPNWKIHGQTGNNRVKRYLYGPGTIFVAHGKNEGLTIGELEAGLEGYKRIIAAAVKRNK
ncbi:hypothetical protein FQN57_000937 [Myotisia sp. PD_48]|nr:hypothetical protein FQN57_000937 [Myotisia sp. PD_48]